MFVAFISSTMCSTRTYVIATLLLVNLVFILAGTNQPKYQFNELQKTQENKSLEQILTQLLVDVDKNKCVALLYDEFYCDVFSKKIFTKFTLTFFVLKSENNETASALYNRTLPVLHQIKMQGCELYIMFISNGTKLANFLHNGHRQRVINTRSKFILLHNNQLFSKDIYYVWNIIINVIFIRMHKEMTYDNKTKEIWYDVSTVPFPYPIRNVLVPSRIDIWRKGKFMIGADFFNDKTQNLKNQTLRIVTFPHIPATAKFISSEKHLKTALSSGSFRYSGVEIEIVQTLSDAMNFIPYVFEPPNAENVKWGEKKNGVYTGLIGEMLRFRADIALGDLHNSPYHMDLMDLTIPYNTECMTFLTPVSLTDNTWMILVLPFQLYMWLAVLAALFTLGLIFYALAKFYYDVYETYESHGLSAHSVSDVYEEQVKIHTSYHDLKVRSKHTYDKPKGLYIFGEIINSVLYTFGMLLLVSLPRFPSGWSLRMLTGWYSLYCSLVAVAYRASMTAILAKPAPRITIDTLEQLQRSRLPCGGWGENVKEFFEILSDVAAQKIAEKFEKVNDSDNAIHRVALGKFAYYENALYLKASSVQRQMQSKTMKQINKNDTYLIGRDREMHIMDKCVINMPVSIGLQKNSPLKNTIDKYMRRISEAGFVQKWLDDVMQSTLNAEIFEESSQTTKALMNLQKFYGAFVALFIGYFLSILFVVAEYLHWYQTVKKHKYYDKYSMQIRYPMVKKQLIVKIID